MIIQDLRQKQGTGLAVSGNMKAVKCKNGSLSLLNRDESSLFNKANMATFLDISSLNERECYVAEEMYKRNVFRKVKRGESVGYKIHPQKEKI